MIYQPHATFVCEIHLFRSLFGSALRRMGSNMGTLAESEQQRGGGSEIERVSELQQAAGGARLRFLAIFMSKFFTFNFKYTREGERDEFHLA